MTLRNPRRETFFAVGELNHTFALKAAHARNAWAVTGDSGRYQLIWKACSGVFYLKWSLGTRVALYGGGFRRTVCERSIMLSWCFRRSGPKRTVCERCERFCERFANAPFEGLAW